MKTKLLRSVFPAALLVMAAFLLAAPVWAADNKTNNKDINTVFQQGRTAFYKGDMETAKALLQQVAAVAPNHFETKALLAQINAYSKPDVSLKKAYSGVVIPKLDFTEVTVSEAMQGLAVMGKNASNGKVSPNFILKDPEMGKKTITLNLANIPMTDALEYVARLAGGKVSYEKHAAVIGGVAE